MIARLSFIFLLLLAQAGCGDSNSAAEKAHAAPAATEFERGPHRGRLLRDGDFALELTIFETNVPPQFRVYAFKGDQPLNPAEVTTSVELGRLDGELNRFTFKPEHDYLTGSGTVTEPHSFDITVKANYAGQSYSWQFASYEGRATIPKSVAEEAGVVVEKAGPALIRDTAQLVGNVTLDANRRAEIKARFPGIVREVAVQEGQHVKRGQKLVVVEANESMRSYSVTAPFDGQVLTRSTNVGDLAESNTLIEIADLSRVWVELHAIGADASQLRAGQSVRIKAATSDAVVETKIETLLPLTNRSQSVVARASIPNTDGQWRPGMAVRADATLAEHRVPLAVKESGLQRFRDFIVVFAQVGETYEVRMLELGARDGEHVEVLGGLKPDTSYVAQQSFLIKADIEKSGASHDH